MSAFVPIKLLMRNEKTTTLGCLFNHSKRMVNLNASVYERNFTPEIWLTAIRNITVDEELPFNNDTRKEVFAANPWLTEKIIM